MTAAIEVDDLVKTYGDLRALDGLSLTVEAGEFFGLLGPNGAGKTTFINILVGLARKDGGDARVFGHDVEAEYRAVRNAVGLSPQEFNVDRFFPIREVLEHKAGYHGVPPAEATDRADEALQQVGIYEKRNERFDWLSGGMKRRFLLARALVTHPDLLILDEPTAGVDVQLRHDIWEIIEGLNDRGTTVLLTTHYIEEAERLCDRVAIVNGGRKLDVASPEELKRRGTDTVTITIDRTPSPHLDADAITAPVEEIESRDDRLVIRAREGGRVAAQVINYLDDLGVEVVDLDISRTSLEEIFVDMTAADREDATAGDREAVTAPDREVA